MDFVFVDFRIRDMGIMDFVCWNVGLGQLEFRDFLWIWVLGLRDFCFRCLGLRHSGFRNFGLRDVFIVLASLL